VGQLAQQRDVNAEQSNPGKWGTSVSRLLPGARGDAVVSAYALAFGVIPGLDDLSGFVLVDGAEAGAFAGRGVNAIEFVSPNSSAS